MRIDEEAKVSILPDESERFPTIIDLEQDSVFVVLELREYRLHSRKPLVNGRVVNLEVHAGERGDCESGIHESGRKKYEDPLSVPALLRDMDRHDSFIEEETMHTVRGRSNEYREDQSDEQDELQ